MPGTLTYHELKEKNVHELREIAKGMTEEAVRGYTQMNKEHLLAAIAKALHIVTHEEHLTDAAFDRLSVKAQIRELKKKRDAAIEANDHEQLRVLRRQIHVLNHSIRKHIVTIG